MQHHRDYRPAHDVDAWWDGDATSQQRQAIIQTSPAYHPVRDWPGLPALAYLRHRLTYIWDDPSLIHMQRLAR